MIENNQLEKSLGKLINHPYYQEWYEIVKDILTNEEFQKRKLFHHHYECSVWDHSVNVSFNAFTIAKKIRGNCVGCAIAGLLHDFYQEAYLFSPELAHLDEKYMVNLKVRKKLFHKHGFTHANQAVENYCLFFPQLVNQRVTNAIRRHMFPLNIIPPRYHEGWIVTLVDKKNSLKEIINPKAFKKNKKPVE